MALDNREIIGVCLQPLGLTTQDCLALIGQCRAIHHKQDTVAYGLVEIQRAGWIADTCLRRGAVHGPISAISAKPVRAGACGGAKHQHGQGDFGQKFHSDCPILAAL